MAVESSGKGTRWILKRGVMNEDGSLGVIDIAVAPFNINPTNVRLEPRMRIADEETLDGHAVMPFVDPGSLTSVTAIDLVAEGVADVHPANPNGIRDLRRLWHMTHQGIRGVHNGRMVRYVWELTWMTMVFGSSQPQFIRTDPSRALLTSLGLVTRPLIISENANNPWLPSWTMTFTVYGRDVREIMDRVGLG